MSSLQPLMTHEMYQHIVERDEALAKLNRVETGVTVAIPCFEQADYLPHALDSVMGQSVHPVRVLVVDDGSPVQGHEIKETCEHYGVDYVRVTNRGLAAARNAAIMLTNTFGFLPLDADDWLDERYIEKTLPLLHDADVVLTGIQEHGPTRNGTYNPGFDRPWQEVTAELILGDYNRFFYCSLFRTEILREVGGYNPKMNLGLEDADLWVDLLKRGVTFDAVEEPLFHYATRPEGMLQTIHRNGGYQQMVAEMRRHHEGG